MSIIEYLWLLVSVGAIIVTVLSASPGRAWWIRVCDFPRAQVLFVGSCMLILAIARLSDWWGSNWVPWVGGTVSLLLLTAMALQAWWFIRLTPLASKEVPGFPSSAVDTSQSASSDDESSSHSRDQQHAHDTVRMRIVTANVDYTNTDTAGTIESLVAHDPDVLALVEPDESWSDALQTHAGQYEHRVTELRAKGRGISLLSRYPIIRSEIRYLVRDDRPSIWAELQMSPVLVVGICVLHPPPPGLPKRSDPGRVSSKPRDLELDIAAEDVASSSIKHWIVAGDFNDVGWSATTMRAKQIGGLLDPRIGRGMFSTFPSYAPFLRYPIDHVLLSEGIMIQDLKRLANIGSDHLPLLADLVIQLEQHA